MNAPSDSESSFINALKQTGIDIIEEGSAVIWTGPNGGNIKPVGPLAGKKVACLVASEFSDFQAYYVASYIGEFGGSLEFIMVDQVTWKFTRPTIKSKGVQGMWGLSINPIPVMGGNKASRSKTISKADPGDYDAVIIIGGHSGDIMSTEQNVLDFINNAYSNGAVIGGIGGGIIPLIAAGIMKDKECTGNEQVSFILKEIAKFKDSQCVMDSRVITSRHTVDTPFFIYSLCNYFEPDFPDKYKDVLTGKTVLMVCGWDFEDFEIAVPVMEFLHRGAKIVIGTFESVIRDRPPLLGLDVVQGNFGMSIPLQEIPESYYSLKKLNDVSMNEFDGLLIPGAFCPWNMIEAKAPLDFLKKADAAGKVLSYMCHGPIAVSAADLVRGKKITGWLASRDAVTSMGGEFNADWAVALDRNHVSGRTTPELPEFIDAITLALLR
ncbi:MAG: DJ-1/PfpI family protein [Spirochaetota bacterium]|nr:MAG: DJ-1/PfpI family protein [Spirochaetota bacterium]